MHKEAPTTGNDISRVQGAAFFGRNIPQKGARPKGTHTIRAIEKVLEKTKSKLLLLL